MSYVELHVRSAFSFLLGGSDTEALAKAAVLCQLAGVALTDRNGVYGSVRLHMAAKENGFRALEGCELVMEDDTVVPVLIANQAAHHRLCEMLTTAHLRAPKGEARVRWAELAADNAGFIALTGDGRRPLAPRVAPARCHGGPRRKCAAR